MKKIFFLIATFVFILFYGCVYPHYYYSPNTQDVPLFTEKNELTGNIAGSFGVVNNSFEIQTGLSLPAHLALTANFMTGGNDNTSNSIADYSKINYFEGTAGYYRSFKDIGLFEIYGGYGKGSQRHAFSAEENNGWFSWIRVPDGSANLTFSKFFIQPDIGIKTQYLEGAFSCRLSRMNFYDLEINNTIYHSDELATLKENSTPWFIEPALTFRGGFKSIKGQVQVVYAGNLGNSDLLFEKFRFSFGLHFNLLIKPSGE